MLTLLQIHADIDTRVTSIRESAKEWPCTKGCDDCCQRLADVPQLRKEEWVLLQEGLAALPPEQRAEIHARIAAFAINPTHRVTCPLLDSVTGGCPVYAHRPVACRTYGFYVQRDKGLYCAEIESRVAENQLTEVIWGNHEVIDQQLARLGETRSLIEWFGEASCETTRGP